MREPLAEDRLAGLLLMLVGGAGGSGGGRMRKGGAMGGGVDSQGMQSRLSTEGAADLTD